MKILVTGGTGFTGAALTRRLAGMGHEVHTLDNKVGIFDDELREMGVSVHLGSIADEKLVYELTEGCEEIHHLAAAFRLVNLNKKVYWDINVTGTRYLMDAAMKFGVKRVVNCSTCGVHGNLKEYPAPETAPIKPEDYYQYTKWEAEKVAMSYCEKGQWVTTLRPAAIYGPGDPERFAMIFRRVANGKFTFLGKGDTFYHPLYIDNLVDALIDCAKVDKCNGESYLIADEDHIAIRELVKKVAVALDVECKLTFLPFWPAYLVSAAVAGVYKLLPGEPPIFPRRLNWFRHNRAFDIAKAKRDFDYNPKVGLDEGLKKTGEWYRERGIV